jgi:hypothetical protein
MADAVVNPYLERWWPFEYKDKCSFILPYVKSSAGDFQDPRFTPCIRLLPKTGMGYNENWAGWRNTRGAERCADPGETIPIHPWWVNRAAILKTMERDEETVRWHDTSRSYLCRERKISSHQKAESIQMKSTNTEDLKRTLINLRYFVILDTKISMRA